MYYIIIIKSVDQVKFTSIKLKILLDFPSPSQGPEQLWPLRIFLLTGVSAYLGEYLARC